METITVTLSQLLALNPCDRDRRAALFEGVEALDAKEALALGIDLADVLWVVARLGRKDLCVRFAILCVKRAQHLSKDPVASYAALSAAQAWLDDPNEETRLRAGRAADAAFGAAYAPNKRNFTETPILAAAYAAAAACALTLPHYSSAIYGTYASRAARAARFAKGNKGYVERWVQEKILLEVLGCVS